MPKLRPNRYQQFSLLKGVSMKNDLIFLYPQSGRNLLIHTGKTLIESVGTKTIKEIIHAVLCGENLRDSTERITRKRLILSNASLMMLFLNGYFNQENFIEDFTRKSVEQIKASPKNKDRWILQWLLGLTDKQVQNVLRDKAVELDKYRIEFDKNIEESLEKLSNDFGRLEGKISLKGKSAKVDWKFFSYLFTAIGSQTLTLRGSDKSLYGKLFEGLILGTTLTTLGFKLIDPKSPGQIEKVFWLSERKDKRESDATLIYKPGKGVRFDIGFIGRGNPEISLDKVSRFETEIRFGRTTHYLSTFIIVDRIGERSRLKELAKRVKGIVIQMSMSYWPKELAYYLNKTLGFKHKILKMNSEEVDAYLKKSIERIDIGKFI